MRPLHDDEWASRSGLLVTRPQRTAADLLRSREDPEAVAQVVADALRHGHASPGEFAAALAPSAALHGFRRGDGMSLLQWLLDLAGDPDSSRWLSQARAQEQAAPHDDDGDTSRDSLVATADIAAEAQQLMREAAQRHAPRPGPQCGAAAPEHRRRKTASR